MAKEGDNVTLECKILQSAEITYFINGMPISNSRGYSRYKVNCQELRIDAAKYPDDNAVFTCKASNNYGVDIKNATLRVFGECIMFFLVVLYELEGADNLLPPSRTTHLHIELNVLLGGPILPCQA